MKRNTFGRRFLYGILRFFVRIASVFVWHYKRVNKYKIKKGETVVVIANHQTDIDPIVILQSFNRPVFCVATDNIFTKPMGTWFFSKVLGAIPKRKGTSDIKAVTEMLKTTKEGGSVLVFPEGNRSYAEFQYYIAPDFGKFIKMFKSTLVIFNLHGGTGTHPRWGNKKRKGPFYGEIKYALPYDDYKDIPDDELTETITQNLKVFDSESGAKYKTKARAEYLERMLFVCPKCGKMHSLVSSGNYIECKECGLKVEFTEDLKLKSEDPEFKFTTLNEWYQFQKETLKKQVIKPGEVLCEDDNVFLNMSDPFEKKERLYEGKMALTDKTLTFGDKVFDLSKITSSSSISGRKLQFTYEDHSYIVKGDERFNPLKYVLYFNKLDTQMKKDKTDKYFSLED